MQYAYALKYRIKEVTAERFGVVKNRAGCVTTEGKSNLGNSGIIGLNYAFVFVPFNKLVNFTVVCSVIDYIA